MVTRTPASRPIFLVGSPRSGTTLLRYMLCSHPRIYVPPESNFIPRFFRRRPTMPLSREQALRILDRIGDYRPFWRDWRGEPLDPHAILAGLTAPTPELLISALYAEYARRYGAVRWGDKSPIYASYVSLLATMFPTSQIIHAIRDARDVTASSLEAYRGPRFFYMDAYYAARTWRARTDSAIRSGRPLSSDRYTEIRYEDLTFDPEGRLRALCQFLGEQFYPEMTTPEIEARHHHHSRGIHQRVRQPVTMASAGRWQRDLPERDRRLVERVAGSLLLELGYPARALEPPTILERLRAIALGSKYAVVVAGMRLLRTIGVFHPTRLLQGRPRSHAGRETDDLSTVVPTSTSESR